MKLGRSQQAWDNVHCSHHLGLIPNNRAGFSFNRYGAKDWTSLGKEEDHKNKYTQIAFNIESEEAFHPAVLGSSPEHTIYAFTIFSQICAVFVFALWKEWK